MELKEGENGLGAVEEGSCCRTIGKEAKLKREDWVMLVAVVEENKVCAFSRSLL